MGIRSCWFPTGFRPDGSYDNCGEPAVCWVTEPGHPNVWGYCLEHSEHPSTRSIEGQVTKFTWEEAIVLEIMAS